jgi:hypothetical protein
MPVASGLDTPSLRQFDWVTNQSGYALEGFTCLRWYD